jgi:hypothetical protein
MTHRPQLYLLVAWLTALPLFATEHHGRVTFNGVPVPGATVTASRGGRQVVTTTGSDGLYSFTCLEDGLWSMDLKMPGFAEAKQNIGIAPGASAMEWQLKILPLDQIKASAAVPLEADAPRPQPKARDENAPETKLPEEDLARSAADGLLINGSVNNGAASPFSQAMAFGNNRSAGKSLYNGGIGITFDNSALDARPFSLTGQNTPKTSYNRMTGLLSLGGPLRIPHLLPSGPNLFLNYQWTRNRNASVQSALVPGSAARSGMFPGAVIDPDIGVPFPGNRIPAGRISPQAQALLNLYPLPNFISSGGYNYQAPLVNSTHQDALQSRFTKNLGRRDGIYGRFAFESFRSGTPSIFSFLDNGNMLGLDAGLNWSHRFNAHLFLNLGYQFSRLTSRTIPYFENRANISGLAGISGNHQDPGDWGPPALVFSSGIAELSDAQSSLQRNQTGAVSYSLLWNRGRHNFRFGGDFRREQFNALSQQNARGTFTFTGAETGTDFADYLLGVPSAAAVAFGNADKYFRESVHDAYFADDWRISPELTLNAGVRWEYGAPITELYGRLVNLDIAPGFSAIAPVVAADPSGALTGHRYPASLVEPDKSGFEPRVGLAWRPLSGSSLVVRAGYGVYYDTSVYQTIAAQMAQQPPLSKSFSIQNTAAYPLTLATGFNAPASVTSATFALDPNFRAGYVHNWQLSLQRDLPASLQMTAAYLGIHGNRAMQEILPNTFPAGAESPCPACPTGFAYLMSNGASTREAGRIQLRRRLNGGFTGTLEYTFSKSIDDAAALGGQGSAATPANLAANNPAQDSASSAAATGRQGLQIAQNWLRPGAERSLSNFDQRHVVSLQFQYSTGMGTRGGMLLSGWKGALWKEWSFASQISAGSGLPETPIYLAPVEGTGVTGTIRPNYTGAPLYEHPAGRYLNPAAYAPAPPGYWGNAGRNTITGPATLTLDASLGRTFRLNDRFNLDLRFDSSNALNHVTFTTWNTVVNSTQFGLPAAANAMRSVQTTVRLRF